MTAIRCALIIGAGLGLAGCYQTNNPPLFFCPGAHAGCRGSHIRDPAISRPHRGL